MEGALHVYVALGQATGSGGHSQPVYACTIYGSMCVGGASGEVGWSGDRDEEVGCGYVHTVCTPLSLCVHPQVTAPTIHTTHNSQHPPPTSHSSHSTHHPRHTLLTASTTHITHYSQHPSPTSHTTTLPHTLVTAPPCPLHTQHCST